MIKGLNNVFQKQSYTREMEKKLQHFKDTCPRRFAYSKSKYHSYLKSEAWLRVETEAIIKQECCQVCGSEHNLQAHHKTYRNLFNEKLSDLIVLCRSCHVRVHN